MSRSSSHAASGRAARKGGPSTTPDRPVLRCSVCQAIVSAAFGLDAHRGGVWCCAYQTQNRLRAEGFERIPSDWGAACAVMGLPVRLMSTGVDPGKGTPAAQHWAPDWLHAAVSIMREATAYDMETGNRAVPHIEGDNRRLLHALGEASDEDRDALVGALRLGGLRGALDVLGPGDPVDIAFGVGWVIPRD